MGNLERQRGERRQRKSTEFWGVGGGSRRSDFLRDLIGEKLDKTEGDGHSTVRAQSKGRYSGKALRGVSTKGGGTEM